MNKHFFIILFFLFGCLNVSYAQATKVEKLNATAKFTLPNKVQLRWATSDFRLYSKIKSNGLIIKRSIKSINGLAVPDSVFIQSSKVIDTIFPYNKAQIMAHPSFDLDTKKALDSLLKNNKIPANATLNDAVMYNDSMQEKFMLSALFSDQNYEAAKVLGLGYEDMDSIVVGNEYYYTFSIKASVDTLPNIALANTVVNTAPGTNQFIAPDEFSALEGDKKITLTWSIQKTKELYTFYNIYRSDNGGTSFNKVNTEPFIYLSAKDITDDMIAYNDSIPANNVAYKYYVKGINVFGEEGLPSLTLTATGKKARLLVAFSIDTIGTITGNTVIMKWKLENVFDANALTHVTSFKPLYGASREVTPQAINTPSYNATIRQATFPFAGSGYYYMQMTDDEGYTYLTLPKLLQTIDSIAPAAPTNLTAVRNGDGRITLKWNKNNEADLKGYQVYYSYLSAGPFLEANEGFVTANTFTETVASANANSSIHYKVAALDKVQNVSTMSTEAVVVLPDEDGPSEPVLISVYPRPEGIRIGWRVGKDPAKYSLQRKFKNESKWTTILTDFKKGQYAELPLVAGEISPANYIDTAFLQHKYYDYRLVAKDEAGRTNASKKITVKPYDDGLRGTIQNFTAVLMPPNQTYTDYQGTLLDATVQGSVVTVKPDGVVAKIRWTYNTNYTASLREFKVYIKDDVALAATDGTLSPTYTLVETISNTYASNTAQAIGVSGYATYLERVQFRSSIAKRIKIVAMHNDGGYSLPVEVVLIP